MTALNPITSKALGGKLGSMQMVLLTAMTLLGFYLCFKEIKRVTLEMASLRDQVESSSRKPRAPRAPTKPDAAGDPGACDPEDTDAGLGDLNAGLVMVMEEDAADEAMDEGLRQMLEHLQQAGQGLAAAPQPRPPPAEVEELVDPADPADQADQADPADQADGDDEGEEQPPAQEGSGLQGSGLQDSGLMAKTKAEIEGLLRENGVPFKKGDAKAKLAGALAEALGAQA